MPTRRLNRDLLWMAIAAVAVVAVLVVLDRLRGSQDYVALTEKAISEGDCDQAERWLAQAFGQATSSQVRKDLLWRLSELYLRSDLWPKALDCWQRMVQEDPCEIRAQLALIEAEYVQADAWTRLGHLQTELWRSVDQRAERLARIIQRSGLSDRPIWQWRAEALRPLTVHDAGAIGSYLYLIRGRALYQQACSSSAGAPSDDLDMAQAALQAAVAADPCLIDAYWYLYKVQLMRARGLERAGDMEGGLRARAKGMDLLKRAAQDSDKARPHVYLLEAMVDEVLAARDLLSVPTGLARLNGRYERLIVDFARSPQALASAAKFWLLQAYYQGLAHRSAYMQKAIDAAAQAVALDPNDSSYALLLAELYYKRSVLAGRQEDADMARSLAEAAAFRAASGRKSGPGASVERACLLQIYNAMAWWALDQILYDLSASPGKAKDQDLRDLTEVTERIVQLAPTPDHPIVLKWKGLLGLASGRTEQAVKQLYQCYRQDKTTKDDDGMLDPLVCYALGKVFAKGPEYGQAAEFMAEALRAGIWLERPCAILEYLDLIGRIGMWVHVISPANPYNLDLFDAIFGQSDKGRALRIRALAGTSQLAQAQAELSSIAQPYTGPILMAQIELLDAQARQVRASLASEQLKAGGLVDTELDLPSDLNPTLADLQRQQAEAVLRLLDVESGLVTEQMAMSAAQVLADAGRLEQAKQLLERFIDTRPRHDRPPIGAIFSRRLLDEPDPKAVPPLRRDQILEQAIAGLDDPVQRSLELGAFYRQSGRLEQAGQQLLAAMELGKEVDWSSRLPVIRQLYANPLAIAAELASELAIGQGDWDKAERIAGEALARDLDGCNGMYYRARLLHAQGQHKQALVVIDQALEQRPIFCAGYMLRASIHTQLGRERDALADMEVAARLSPDSAQVAKGLAVTLYWAANRQGQRGQLAAQIRSALERALRLDPYDPRLLGIYAEQIKDAEPLKALQVYQVLLRYEPTAQNALALAELATSVASRHGPGSPRSGLLEVARLALEHAYALEPNNPQVIQQYASYYQQIGQPEKAQQMLQNLQRTSMAWKELVAQGKLGQAKALLEKTIQEDPNNPDALEGLMHIAQSTGDHKALIEYSDRLIQIRQGPNYRAEQVMILITTGLIEEARQRLDQLKDLYPEQEDIGLLEGWLLVHSGQLSRARARIEQVVRSYPENQRAWLVKGHIAMLGCRFDQAIEAFSKVVSDEQGPGRRIMLADAYRLAGKIQQATDLLEDLLDQPDAAWQAIRRLQWLYRHEPNAPQVELAYQKVAAEFADQPRWLNRVARHALEKGDLQKAIGLFAKAMGIVRDAADGNAARAFANPDYLDACQGYIEALVQARDMEGLRSALAQVPAGVDVPVPATILCWTAKARYVLGDQTGAIADARQAILNASEDIQLLGPVMQVLGALLDDPAMEREVEAIGQDRPAYWVAKAEMALMQRRFDEALTAIDRYMAVSGKAGTDLARYKGQALVLAYDLTADNRFLRDALAVYEGLAAQMPTDSGVLNNLAYLLAQTPDQAQRALELAQRALGLDADSPAVMDTYGYALYRNGRLQEALEWLLAASAQFQVNCIETPADVYEHIGMVYQALGQKDKALEAYKQGLAAVGDNATARARIQAAIQGLGP